MYEVARRDRPGAGTHVSENNANTDKQADLSPGAPELLCMGESKECAGGQNACSDAKFAGDHGIDTARKNGSSTTGATRIPRAISHQTPCPPRKSSSRGMPESPPPKIPH